MKTFPTAYLVSFGRLQPTCILLLIALLKIPAFTQDNIWTNEVSGKWEQADNWYLGIPPAADQTVYIFTEGWKSVAIDAATVASAPETLAIRNLVVRSDNGLNTLLLNWAGTDVPLRVKSNLTVNVNGVLMNLHSSVLVDDGGLNIINGKLIQDGGFVIATNTSAFLTGGYELTNGILQVSNIYLGGIFTGTLNQYGGTAMANAVQVGDTGSYNALGSGYYNLHGGMLTAKQIHIGGQNTYSPFIQNGGTNLVGDLLLAGYYNTPGSAPAHYFLNGGALCASNTTVSATLYAAAKFEQTGGIHSISNRLTLMGESSHGITFYIARYVLKGGELTARSLKLDSYSSLLLSNGTASVAETIEFQGRLRHRETSFLAGGILACSDVTCSDAGIHLTQTGGALVVSNRFSFGGIPDVEPLGLATYNFAGGTLTASNIEMNSIMTIGENGQTARITNPGYFKLGGSLTVSNADEQLGRFILASNSTINLAGGSCKLAFANSSSENWTNSTRLSVLNWNGATNGGGADRLMFGDDASGLTTEQLSQIRFVNPVGFPGGTNCAAKILATGEVVPVIVWPWLTSTLDGKYLVLTWPATCVLQASTNVAGPFLDNPGVPCPLTIDMSLSSQWFFRVRQAY